MHCGTLLRNGRFAFLMTKKHADLRSLIEHYMRLRSSEGYGPFSKGEAEHLMYHIAFGVEFFHYQDIVDRDLKASNVLVRKFGR